MRYNFILSCCLGLVFLITGISVNAAVYEASTLHNAVARSETVMDLFVKRWDIIQEKELYVDGYLKLNWVPGFQVNYVDKGNDEVKAVDMRLVRTYGSITVNYPVLGGYEGTDLDSRVAKWTGAKVKEKKDDPLFKPKNLIVGFTATGFHYGLTSESEINRGAAGTETVTDYKFSQFFDDIFALSLLYRPYFFIHAGVVINNMIEPNDDGSMDYTFDDITKRYFIKSDLLSCLNLNASTTEGEFESYAVGLNINNLLNFVIDAVKGKNMPTLKVAYKALNAFNDEPYETVWVKSADGKSMAMDDKDKESAVLRTFSFDLRGNMNRMFYYSAYAEFQAPSETLIEKRTGEELDYAAVREVAATVGVDWFRFIKMKGYQKCITTFGLSRYWDAAIPVHRNPDENDEIVENYKLFGWFFAVNWEYTFTGAEFKVAYNYSDELRKLVETSDKLNLEASFFMRY